jgi:transcription elongation factor GreB
VGVDFFMSKAFTRESDEFDDEIPSTPRPQLPHGTVNYITREGAESLKLRLDALLEKKRQSSDAPGSDVRKLDAKIRALQQTLSSVVVSQPASNPDKVAFGTTVRIHHENGEEETYRIVGIEEADPENGSISWLSPLARALLSRRVGDKVRLRTPAGSEELTLLGIE